MALDHLDPWAAATAHDDLAVPHRESGEGRAAAQAAAEARRRHAAPAARPAAGRPGRARRRGAAVRPRAELTRTA
ncbi:hypothetical protein [Streptomyces caatingaensis]|uniref:Uncharacterized protein n=1 Tax=Streptomyces caatingaensis TaxID=1678637 RepID=A0A0K9XGW1_9ACTN|nr:hypothetical protein [Streptomyces caatingaensis]KNB52291.1 hypothetical protein AC230_12140 [Streptomyces caatingaensis]